jgi:hypothetical protein
MTKAEAEQACAKLRKEHPERATHQFQPREGPDGSWSVVKIALPPINETPQAELRG